MPSTRDFFESHRKDVDDVSSMLADERSQKVYNNMIKFRGSYDRRCNRDYSIFDQYFVNDIVRPDSSECFVDCGAYVGDTIERFNRWAMRGGTEYRAVIGLEPDASNFNKLNRYVNMHFSGTDSKALNLGAWDKKETLHFNESGTGGIITDNGRVSIEVSPLDSIPECHNATFIKMDIEGAEQRALKGAMGIIESNHPKLAICIYHSDEDMIEIPMWIHDKFPFYKLYVRQHSPIYTETVLYCIPG